jgi:hypothetical protein
MLANFFACILASYLTEASAPLPALLAQLIFGKNNRIEHIWIIAVLYAPINKNALQELPGERHLTTIQAT